MPAIWSPAAQLPSSRPTSKRRTSPGASSISPSPAGRPGCSWPRTKRAHGWRHSRRSDRPAMPIRFTIDHAKRHVEARAEGETGLAHFEDFLDAIVVQGALPYRKLFDSRKAIGKLSDDDVMML